MNNEYDEISFKYWNENRQKLNSKSYICNHDGFVYGDKMLLTYMQYIYRDEKQTITCGSASGNKITAYKDFVENACNLSNDIFRSYKDEVSEKFRIYSEGEVDKFTKTKFLSTRIKKKNAIVIHGENYYAATNLKVCEYINSACVHTPSELQNKWFIRIYLNEADYVNSLLDRDEYDQIEINGSKKFEITMVSENHTQYSTKEKRTSQSPRIVKIDFDALNKYKKKVGDVGEQIVMQYEREYLRLHGREDLARKIVHSSIELGDGLGYDIKSYDLSGTEKFIEVKSTKKDNQNDFYMPDNEMKMANKIFAEGGLYKIYRVYDIDENKLTAKICQYDPPIPDGLFEMVPVTWKVSFKSK